MLTMIFPHRWRSLLVALVFLGSSMLLGYTVEEIRQLQELGFTHEQIVELQARQAGTDPAQAGGDQGTGTLSESGLAKMRRLREQGKGLLIVCFTKEWIQRGPGFLYFDRKGPDGKWIPVGQAMALDYAKNGGYGPPKIEHTTRVVKKHGHDGKGDRKDGHHAKDGKKDGHEAQVEKTIIHEETIVHPRELVTSRYFAEFEMPEGQYELKAERLFFTGEDEDTGLIKIRRRRVMHGVQVGSGRATIISYCWNENATFGLDHPVPALHRAWVDSIAASLGPLLTEVRH